MRIRKLIFRHKKCQILPQIAVFRHILPEFGTFFPCRGTMTYFCDVFMNASRRFDKFNDLRVTELAGGPESKSNVNENE